MAQHDPSQTAHLRVQLTLAGGRRGATSRHGSFQGNLRVGINQFLAEIHPEEPLMPGGHAVHCAVYFADPAAAMTHFPAGANFEIWDGGRVGYGMVLAVQR
ncbi:hypothetical protein [Opitutus sp. ER46]|uniref:hypothetical protein n=1 Tax=Opitutus sp. ER46 TaxID=2161864 RepID=UPI0011B23584|nr:hypothetical protein [Opitutus sp. ER46]